MNCATASTVKAARSKCCSALVQYVHAQPQVSKHNVHAAPDNAASSFHPHPIPFAIAPNRVSGTRCISNITPDSFPQPHTHPPHPERAPKTLAHQIAIIRFLSKQTPRLAACKISLLSSHAANASESLLTLALRHLHDSAESVKPGNPAPPREENLRRKLTQRQVRMVWTEEKAFLEAFTGLRWCKRLDSMDRPLGLPAHGTKWYRT